MIKIWEERRSVGYSTSTIISQTPWGREWSCFAADNLSELLK